MTRLNHKNVVGAIFICALFFTRCQSDAHLHNSYKIGEKRCFVLNTPDLNELIEIEFDPQGFAGEGQGYLPVLDKKYKILLKGDCSGLDCEITTQLTYLEAGSQPFTLSEQWLFKDKNQLIVEKRQLQGVNSEQAFIYRQINCPQRKEKDSTLYDFIGYFSDGYAVVSRGGRFGIVDSNLQLSVPCTYPNIGDIHEGTATFAGESNAYVGILSVRGEIISPAVFERASNFSNNRAAVIPQGSDKWGFINRKGELIIPAQYNQVYLYEGLVDVRPFLENLAPVAIDNVWGFIDTNGVTVIPFQYEQAQGFKGGKARVFYQGKWQMINKKGEIGG